MVYLQMPGVMASDQDSKLAISISWKPPHHLPVNDNEYLEVLYFEGAVFSDSLPRLPVFSHRVANPVPHFSHTFRISDEVFEPVNKEEAQILRESEFRQDRITLHTSMQSASKERYAVVQLFPFRYNASSDSFEKLTSFSLETSHDYDSQLKYTQKRAYPDNSVLAEGSWYRLSVDETGIYRIGYDQLEELGLDPSTVVKEDIRLFGNGNGMLPEANAAGAITDLEENAIYVSGDASATFGPEDYILFYGMAPDRWHWDEDSGRFLHQGNPYTDINCYFITVDNGKGKRIATQPSTNQEVTHQVSTFRDRMVHHRELENIIGSGRLWFGETFDSSAPRQFSFDIPNLNTDARASVEADVAARASMTSNFTLSAAGGETRIQVAPVNPADYNGFQARRANEVLYFTPDSQDGLTIRLAYNRPATGTRGWLRHLVVNVDRNMIYSGSQMDFRVTDHVGEDRVFEYVMAGADSQVQVWDVSDRFNVKSQEVTHSGNALGFRLPGDEIREMVAFDGTGFLNPTPNGRVENQNLHGMESRDLIIVVPENMLAQAKRLGDFRRENDGLSVGVVTTRQVYNEFASGVPDISSIRNFMKMFYDRADTPGQIPRYLLLFGNGTIDNKDRLGYGGNLIPTYQSEASLAPRTSYMTDDYFGLLADHEGQGADGVLDIGIGRLPVRTPEEAGVMVDKIIRYEKRIDGLHPETENMQYTGVVSNYADWRNTMVFIADDGDMNTHFIHAELLSDIVRNNYSSYNVDKIYLDAYQQVTTSGGTRYPEVNRAINERVNKGALMINYIGHGGVRGLAQQRILTFDDIATWDNKYNMPVFMTATCNFSSFDQPDPEELSAGVRIVLKPEGGSAALYTTTRLAWSGSNLVLNRNFTANVFERNAAGEHHRLGDLIRIAKRESSGGSTPMQLRNFVLLGDPSMQMAYPEYRVVTEQMPDTIRAFQEVEVSGYVTDVSGNKLEGYDGVLFPTVYDKRTTYQTLGNNPGSMEAEFNVRNAILYKGMASVKDGGFTFRFVVPKDIAYDFGEGKISYYLDDGKTDGNGHYRDFTIGGTLDSFQPDDDGPEISLFLNDTNFVSGDHTNENPILLAYLRDESGINMTGRVGHDIVAFLNDKQSDPIRLNSYYKADRDAYHSGQVVYPFHDLEDGRHRLTLRAWDVNNNPATATIEFIVGSAGRLTLHDLMNYPNPFSTETWFTFNHNQAFSELDVRIDIFDLQGRLVDRITQTVSSPGFRIEPIRWDGVSNDGRSLANGLYIYRLILETPDGQQAVQTEKLLLLRQ